MPFNVISFFTNVPAAPPLPPLQPLLHVLRPLLFSASMLRRSVLLRGARGSGKRRLVERACAHLGLHCVQLNVFELLEATERQTAERLLAVLKARAYSGPAATVVHLRRLSALAAHARAQQREDVALLARALDAALSHSHPLLVVASTDEDVRHHHHRHHHHIVILLFSNLEFNFFDFQNCFFVISYPLIVVVNTAWCPYCCQHMTQFYPFHQFFY